MGITSPCSGSHAQLYSHAPTSFQRPNYNHTPSVLVLILDDNQIPLPRSDKAILRDEEMIIIEEFLRTPIRPNDMDNQQLRRLVKKASEFFILDNKLWKRDPNGRHKLIIPYNKRLGLIRDVHDELGHKGIFSVRTRLLDRFWWPLLDQDVRWYIKTCHECQVRLLTKIHIPPTVPTPASLFRKVYIDTFLMPKSGGYRYIVHARCSLSSYPEWRMLRRETGETIGAFIFQEILC